MSLDTSLRSAERAGDWRAQVTYLRRAGRLEDAIRAVEARRSELESPSRAIIRAVKNERLVRATERPAVERMVAVSREILETGDMLRELRAEQAAQVARTGQVLWRCPDERCNHHKIGPAWLDGPACRPCAEEGKWVRMERVQ